MNDTQAATELAAPSDPVMAAGDPGMFATLSRDENGILVAHLTSGWYKQAAVYPVLSEPWKETAATLDDLHAANEASRAACQADREPEAG